MNSTLRSRLLASTLLIGAATLATPAWAQSQDTSAEPPVTSEADPDAGSQDPGAEGQEGEAEGEIIVTGSRIPRRDLTSTSPLAVVQDEEFQLSGSANAEQVINTLPQVAPTTTAFSNNPGGGVATINLRGLGSQRNLVLVNGRRYIFFDTGQVVDINTVPTFLLDSVDVITGGASAVYGSDALAGVTNFRLRTDINGVLAGGSLGITSRGDGHRENLYTAIGTTFADNRGYVAAYGEYLDRGDIFQGAREFSRFALGDASADALGPFGSSFVPQGRITAPLSAGTNFAGAGAFFQTPGQSIPYCGAPCSYNYAPSNYLMVPQERWTLGGYGEYEMFEGARAYGEVTFINNRVDNELAATPISQAVNVNVAQACQLVSAADCAALQLIAQRQQAAIAAGQMTGLGPAFGGATTVTTPEPGEVRLGAGYRTTQISNRRSLDDRNAFRILGGIRGELTQNLNYDVYYMNSRTKNANVQIGNVSRSGFVNNVENGTCNIFGQNQLSDECLANISILAQNQEESRLQVVQGSVSGSVFQIPWATDAVGFAAGLEYRKMDAEFVPDTALSSGDVVGFNAGDPTAGGYNVQEVFGELRVPIVQGGFLHRFEVNGAARYSDYSLEAVGGVPTYAVGVELAPVPDITARAQYQRAVRAPNVGELFGGQSVGFPPATDPCATPAALTDQTLRNLCIATGVPANQVGNPALQPNQQIQGVFGGNPNLQEEVGDTYTAGVVFRPRFIPRLNVAIDWYDIKIDNAIAAAGGGVASILNLCYNVVRDPNSPLCQAVRRDPGTGIIGEPPYVVQATNANLASLETSGIDMQLDYTLPLQMGLMGQASRLNFYFFGTRTSKNNYTPVVGVDEPVKCAGRFGLQCGNPTPRYKWTSRLSWLDGPMTTSLRWRHIGRVRDDDDQTNYVVESIKAKNYFDLSFAWEVGDNYTLTLGSNNIFDKGPPILGDNQEQANTYPSTYDVIGRDFFMSVNLRL